MQFLTYEIKAAAVYAVFYLFYRLLLSRENFHRLNRIVLIGTALLAMILPLCEITFHKSIAAPAFVARGSLTGAVPEPGEGKELWTVILLSVFSAGALAVVARTVISVIGVLKVIRCGRSLPLEGGAVLVVVKEDISPFSWMKWVVMSESDYSGDHKAILVHELAHVALGHSWDVLFSSLFTAAQWFSPAAWMMKSDLCAIHEYEADLKVLESGIDARQYQYLLIRKAAGPGVCPVSSSFNHSTLKKRIAMMLSRRSSRISALKALYIIPLIVISLAANAKTVFVTVPLPPVTSGANSANVSGTAIYINGELSGDAAMKAVSPGDIDSIKVDKAHRRIDVYTRR